jgi:large subunit ribosomal protein L18
MARKSKLENRKIRHRSLRKRISGTAERPRLVVFRSARHIYAQVIDDLAQKTLVAASDLTKKAEKKADKSAEKKADKSVEKTAAKPAESTEGGKAPKKSERAKQVGTALAKLCLEKGISKVVFDRGGYKYHGRVSAVAAGAREGGLDF